MERRSACALASQGQLMALARDRKLVRPKGLQLAQTRLQRCQHSIGPCWPRMPTHTKFPNLRSSHRKPTCSRRRMNRSSTKGPCQYCSPCSELHSPGAPPPSTIEPLRPRRTRLPLAMLSHCCRRHRVGCYRTLRSCPRMLRSSIQGHHNSTLTMTESDQL